MRVAIFVGAVSLLGCFAPAEGQFACPALDHACPGDWHCRSDGRCYSTPEGGDAGTFDAGAVDAAGIDAAGIDASLDATTTDAGTDAGGDPECVDAKDCAGDDGNPCTDLTCEVGSCVHVAHDRSCDDGMFCNGADTCAGGACAVHSGNPCDANQLCEGAACVPCGGYNEPCCLAGMCAGDRRCRSDSTCSCIGDSDCPGSNCVLSDGSCVPAP